MKLILKSQSKKLQANWKKSEKADAEGKEFNPKVVVKLFNPTGAGEWYIFEQNPDKPDILYGLCNIHVPEWGYVSLSELQNFRGQMGLGIERDMYYTAITKNELQEKLDNGETYLG